MKKDANRKKLETLIESMVVEVLNEEYDIVTQDPLIKIFISPFTDVIKTAKGEIEKNLAIGYSTITNLAKQAAVLAIPIFASSMIKDIQEKSDQELQERLGKINERYAEVLKRNWDTVRGRDVWGITFMLDPTFGIAEKFILRAPYAALGTLEALTGGNPKVTELKEKAAKLVHHVTPEYFASFGGGVTSGGGGYGGGWGGGYGGWGDFGGDFGGFGDGGGFGGESVQSDKPVMSEQQAQQAQKKQLTPQQKQQLAQINKQIAAAVMQLKNDPSVQKSIQASPVAQQLQAGALESIMDVAKPVMAATTYEQIKSAIGPEFKKFEQDLLKDVPQEMKAPDKLKELQQSLVPELKKAYKSVLLKQLQGLAKNHPNIAKPMGNLIQQINKM